MSDPLHLTKHHGQGNDFLVVVDLEDRWQIGPSTTKFLCDRRRGIGADGLIRAIAHSEASDFSTPYEIVCRMELTNADGSRAEMSGNGIRCLAHALWSDGTARGDEILISTDAGVRQLRLLALLPTTAIATVSCDMGPVIVEDVVDPVDLAWWPGGGPSGILRAQLVNAGNPHLVVVVDDCANEDGLLAGERAQAIFADSGGINLEIVSIGSSGSITMFVFERGVGATLACGTGSCAAAAVVHCMGAVGNDVTVQNPGGPVTVTLAQSNGRDYGAILVGDVTKVAEIEFQAHDLETLVAGNN